MEKVLNQEEIDAMVRAARGGPAGTAQPEVEPVERWDVKSCEQIGRDQLQAITSLHEGLARNLTHSLGAYLRVFFAAALVSAEHLSYREFLQRVPETTYFAGCRLEPMGISTALQLDLKVAFPIIDLLLGGEGKPMAESREITEIEEQILDSVARIICRELGACWQALALDVGFQERLEPAMAQRLLPPEEKILSLSFEITMPEVRGGLNVAMPVAVSNALLRKISADWEHRPARVQPDCRARLMRRLLDAEFLLELGAKDIRLPLHSLAPLTPGTVLCFSRSVSAPASLLIAGREMFRAIPARRSESRAARVLEPAAETNTSQDAKENPR